jgi:putative membrane protein
MSLSSASPPPHWFPKLLLALYLVEFVGLGLHPAERGTWVAENAPIFLIAAALTGLYLRGVRFSNLAYLLMSVLLFLHTIGGHYTFEKVPFAWFDNLFGFKRNMFDRVAHVTVGFYAFAIIELTDRYGTIRSRVISYLFPLCVIGTVAMTYELIEWLYADLSDPAAGSAFLGSQGDIWDAQKDMLADTSGAVLALLLYGLHNTFTGSQRS